MESRVLQSSYFSLSALLTRFFCFYRYWLNEIDITLLIFSSSQTEPPLPTTSACMKDLENFLQNLEKLNPTEEELAKTESSHLLLDKYTVTFTIKIVNPDNLNNSNPVLTIVEHCDTTTFEVFAIRFHRESKNVRSYQAFGNDEADVLAIDKKTGEVVKILYTVFHDYEMGAVSDIEEEYVMPVASSQEGFLKALYYSCALQSKIIKDEIDLRSNQDLEKRCDFAKRSTSEAGGERYHDFWHQSSNCFR